MRKSLLIYDASELSFVGLTWRIGARLFAFDQVLAVYGAEDCYAKIEALSSSGVRFDDIQVWGHGLPGFVFLNSEPLAWEFWDHLAHLVRDSSSTVWLRVCAFAATRRGQANCEHASKALGCGLVAHTHIIGTWACHSGLYGILPNQAAYWPTCAESPGEPPPRSTPFEARTVSAFRMTLPEWAFGG